MTRDDKPCAYCGHPRTHHAPGRCYSDVHGFDNHWRTCTCTTYRTEDP